MAKIPKEKLLHMHRLMLDIRNFDNKVNQMVKKGQVPGMTHFSVGEEAANVGAIAAIGQQDFITSNHRGHGQSIAMEIVLNGMMAEIMGKATELVKAKAAPCILLIWIMAILVPMALLAEAWEWLLVLR
jgi:pyruvate dehydrogenase E1 component alpha subunit